MISGLILTIGSTFFLVLLFVSYFSKKMLPSIRNKLYRYLLVTALLLLITEILAGFYFEYGTSELLKNLLLRLHWFTGIPWFLFLYFYSICYLKNLEADNLKELILANTRFKIYTVFSIIYLIIYLFLPFKKMTMDNFTFLPGTAAYYIVVYCSITVIITILFLFREAKDTTLRKKIATTLMLFEMIVIFGLQMIFQQTVFMGLGAAFQMFFLYFIIENPDLFLIVELEQVKSEIERTSKAKTDFLSNMSHEIRTPMNAIVGFSESIMNDNEFDEERTRNDIHHIEMSSKSLLEIINNILDISKIESGKETLELKEYSLKNIIMELSSIIGARIGNKHINLILDVDKDIPSILYGDSTKLFQILLNILTNSAKYTEVGKIILTVDKVIKDKNVLLKFKIYDTGYGIKEEDYNKVFEKFSRLDNATNNEIEGTGLGLVITKKYVDLMGGKIWFESEYGVGTSFYVEILQEIRNKESLGDITKPIKDGDNKEYIDCSKYNILIVDDNKLNLKVAQRILSKYKFNIDLCESGKDCIYKVKEGKHYDMIFMDHMMPDMDGIETMHILKKLEGYDIPPIIALTANAITGVKEMYLKEGFDEYLSKPIDISELNKLINKYFK